MELGLILSCLLIGIGIGTFVGASIATRFYRELDVHNVRASQWKGGTVVTSVVMTAFPEQDGRVYLRTPNGRLDVTTFDDLGKMRVPACRKADTLRV